MPIGVINPSIVNDQQPDPVSLCGVDYYWGEEPMDDAELERPTKINGPAAAILFLLHYESLK